MSVLTVVRLAVALSDAARRPAPHTLPEAVPRGCGERVLIVDDNDDAATLLHEALASLGYEVPTAADGPSALNIDEEFPPAIGLLDIGLPVMDGYELAQQLQARRDIRLVAVTGYGQRSDRERARVVGFDAHLVKPIALDELARVLDRLRQSPAGQAPGRDA